jgi:hypothetical protein
MAHSRWLYGSWVGRGFGVAPGARAVLFAVVGALDAEAAERWRNGGALIGGGAAASGESGGLRWARASWRGASGATHGQAPPAEHRRRGPSAIFGSSRRRSPRGQAQRPQDAVSAVCALLAGGASARVFVSPPGAVPDCESPSHFVWSRPAA